MLRERVLVLGTGTLGQTIREELMTGDYRQTLIQDPEVDRKVLEAVYRLGSEKTLGPEEERLLRDDVDVIVLAFENQGWPERLPVKESRGKLKLLDKCGNVLQMASYKPGPAP